MIMDNTTQLQNKAWQAAKDLYNQMPEKFKADISRECWENVMPWVVNKACELYRKGQSPQLAIKNAFISFRDFLEELAIGESDMAKAAFEYISAATYKSCRIS